MIADPQPTLPDPRTDDADDLTGEGERSATAPAEGADTDRGPGTPRDPALPDD